MNTFLVHLLDINQLRKTKRGQSLRTSSTRTDFSTLPKLCSRCGPPMLLQHFERNESYRNVKRKVRSYQHYRDFAPTYTYHNGKVKFSKVRAVLFWHYYDAPPKDNYNSLGIEWWSYIHFMSTSFYG